ncbi:BRO family, N-terminal domain [Klebsiella pneumoniae]|uniref:BRO family, N-terminal domain n=1 Tax=Klebsiella pneumoniae TaxID=573 RepID=A0AB74GKG1_KLEPN|nr:BRO family, N-terminal domain [Klebsiella pneumoniae]
MPNQFVFKSHTLEAIDHEGKLWFTAATLASALEYADARSVTNIYNRNTDEFTSCMSLVIKMVTSGKINGLQHKAVRVFSLRGAHLIAMFASTPVAKEFRRWVLDLIEKESSIPQSSTVIAPHRECLPKMVYHHRSKYNPYRAYVTDNGKSVYVGCYPTVEEAVAAQRQYFNTGEVKRIQEISDSEKEMFIGNLQAILHNFRRIDEIWRAQLRPALEAMDSKLVYLLYDRFNDSMAVLPTIESRVGRYVPPKLPR